MVEIELTDDHMTVHILGWHRLLALKRRLEIPLAHVRSVRATPDIDRRPRAFKMPGSYIQGKLTAGTFWRRGYRAFWDVANTNNAITIDLENNRFKQLILEVADPTQTIARIEHALAARSPAS